MPLDGMTLGFAARELNSLLGGGRVDRISQPEKDTVVLLIRAGNENRRLLLCASPNNARAHLTRLTFPNPLEPPVFCMLLRKQLLGARVQAVTQVGGDRVLHVDFEAVDELGDHVLRRLVLEVMGRHSNLMLLSGEERILDAARHVSADMSRVRQVQPGLPYAPPPAQDKLDPADITAEALQERLRAQGEMPLKNALQSCVTGLSAATAAELAFRVLNPGETRPEDLAEASRRLSTFLRSLPERFAPCYLPDGEGGAADVFAFPYLSRSPADQRPSPTLSEALERYFSARDAKDRISQKSASMLHLLKGQVERCEKKLAMQSEELASAERAEEYRIKGEMLNASLYQLRRGMTEVTLPNFYDPEGGTLLITLDERLSPAENAQRYFKRYQKARSALKTAAAQREKTLEELNYLEGLLLDVGKCVEESELEEIREELARTGYMKRVTSRKERRALPPSKPLRFVSSDGIEILVGKNAVQNERLTQSARPDETWLHAKDMPGSHVIIRREGEVPLTTLREAAVLAAWFSKGQRSANVPIDYTLRRYVKKPGGTPPGFVIYTHQHTAFITAGEAEVKRIARQSGAEEEGR